MIIPYGRQNISESDIEAVVDVLRSDFLTQGPLINCFEKALANHVGAEFAVAVNSATSALHIACLALDIGPGDWVWTTPNTFVASANCALYCGAKIDFVDIDSETYNICPVLLEKKLERARIDGRLPKAVIVVHFAGQSCEMLAFHVLAQRFGFKLIEDASHAVGARYLGQPVGNCRYSDITIFSFHPVKIITTAEGGAAVTNDPYLASRMELFRSHGVTRKEDLMVNQSEGPWYYQQVDLGFNYRLTELQSALGLNQLQRMAEFIERRHILAERYDVLLEGMAVVTPFQHPNNYSALHLYPIKIDTDATEKSRLSVFEGMRNRGIGVNVHYIPVHMQPYYQRLGFAKGDFPVAEAYYARAISLPLYPDLTFEQQDYVVASLREEL